MADELQRDFDRKVKEIIRLIEQHEERSIRAAIELASEVQKEILGEVSTAREFNAFVLRQLERSIGLRVDEFKRELTAKVGESQKASFDLGVKLVDEPVALITRPVIGVSRELLQVAAQFSATLIGDVSESLRARITGVLQRTALGSLGVQDAIEQLGRDLKQTGPFKSAAARAETIVRTEVLRIQSIAAQARLKENAKATERAGYRLRKSWLSARDPFVRAWHGLGVQGPSGEILTGGADGQIVDVDQPFQVGPEMLMYPRDPNGSPQNTINCRCVSRPIVERSDR